MSAQPLDADLDSWSVDISLLRPPPTLTSSIELKGTAMAVKELKTFTEEEVAKVHTHSRIQVPRRTNSLTCFNTA